MKYGSIKYGTQQENDTNPKQDTGITVDALQKDFIRYKEEFDAMKDEVRLGMDKQSFSNIQILGIFSSIMGFVIISIDIIKNIPSFLAAILLICGLANTLYIFAVTIHNLFKNDESKKDKSLVWPVIIMTILIIIGVSKYYLIDTDKSVEINDRIKILRGIIIPGNKLEEIGVLREKYPELFK